MKFIALLALFLLVLHILPNTDGGLITGLLAIFNGIGDIITNFINENQ